MLSFAVLTDRLLVTAKLTSNLAVLATSIVLGKVQKEADLIALYSTHLAVVAKLVAVAALRS